MRVDMLIFEPRHQCRREQQIVRCALENLELLRSLTQLSPPIGVRELAEISGRSPRVIRRDARAGKFPVAAIDPSARQLQFRRVDVEATYGKGIQT